MPRARRHFREADREPAIRQVVHGRDGPRADQPADEIAVAPLGLEIDRRRRALATSADVAEVERLPEPALRLADEQHGLAGRLEAGGRDPRDVVDEADAADRRGRQDAAAAGLVVERHVARHDREVERAGRLADPADAAHEFAHGFGLLGVAEIEVVGQGQGQGPDGGEVAPGLRHGLPPARDRIGRAIARRHVGHERQPLGAILDAHHRGVGAAGTHDGVAADQVVVLLPGPALRGRGRACRATPAAPRGPTSGPRRRRARSRAARVLRHGGGRRAAPGRRVP